MRRSRLGLHASLIVLLTLLAVVASSPVEATWLPHGTPICTDTLDQDQVGIVSDGAQGAIVVWADDRFSGRTVLAQRVNANGDVQWAADGVRVCPVGSLQSFPSAAIAPGGGALVCWEDARNGNRDIFVQLLDGQGLPLLTPNGVPLGTSSTVDTRPQPIPDGATTVPGWIVPWVSQISATIEVRAQHVDANGAGMWTTASSGGITVASNLSSLDAPTIASDGVGGPGAKSAVIAWHRSTSVPLGFDVFVQRVDGSGVRQWPASGVTVCSLPGDQTFPTLARVGTGVTILVWQDRRNTHIDLYAQKFDASGNAQWLANGLPVSGASGAQWLQRLIPDDAGGVIVVWNDERSGTGKVYAQRIDGNGQPLWTLDGIPLCSGSGLQYGPTIVSDGVGGAIVVWQDYRNAPQAGIGDLYAQRVTASGTLLWSAEGALVTSATGPQISPALASDSQSGALVAWIDRRANEHIGDIYATRLTATPSVGVPIGDQTVFRLGLDSSNPARGDVRLRLDLPEAASVTADVLDAQGRRVRLLCRGSALGRGSHLVSWDGADEAGRAVRPGIYFARVRAAGGSLTTRVVRLD